MKGFLGLVALIVVVMAVAASLTSPHTDTRSGPSSSATPPPRPKIITTPKVDLTKWQAEAGGRIAKMSFRISNVSADSWVSDVKVECAFTGNSGTVISRRAETVFETIKPNQSISVQNLNYGLIDQQVKQASCAVVAAKACCNYEVGF